MPCWTASEERILYTIAVVNIMELVKMIWSTLLDIVTTIMCLKPVQGMKTEGMLFRVYIHNVHELWHKRSRWPSILTNLENWVEHASDGM